MVVEIHEIHYRLFKFSTAQVVGDNTFFFFVFSFKGRCNDKCKMYLGSFVVSCVVFALLQVNGGTKRKMFEIF